MRGGRARAGVPGRACQGGRARARDNETVSLLCTKVLYVNKPSGA